MLYVRRFGAFLPAVSLVTSTVIAYLIKDYLAARCPEYWKIIIIPIMLLLFGATYCIFYVCNSVLIRLVGKADFVPRLENRWRDAMCGVAPTASAEDYVDRVADWQLRISMPPVVQGVVAALLSEQKGALASLQQALDFYTSGDQFGAFVNILGSQWRTVRSPIIRQPLLIDDPIHGCITLDSSLATIIDQPIVQRLSHVRQLSFSYAHFPSASHSRFSHILGVAHNVEKALTGIFSRGVYYEEGSAEPADLPRYTLEQRDRIIQKAKVLAILHDLGHGPFGHALDNYVGYINKYQVTPNPDKVYSRIYVERYLSAVLRKLDFDPDELARILNPEERAFLTQFDYLIGELIDSPMDVDRMDYLMRDAHMTGLSMGFTNADALIQCIRPLKAGDAYLLAYDEAGVEYMEHLLYAREAMYRSCYEHPRKRAAERLFERLIREVAADDAGIVDDLYILTDDELLTALRLAKLKSDAAKRLLDELIRNAEYSVVHDVRANSSGISELARSWVRSAAKGRGKPSYIDQPAQWEDAIARASIGAERGFQIQVIVAPPSAYEPKFNAALILFRENGAYCTREFFDVASEAKNVLSAMNPARARIRVMCPSDIGADDRAKVKQAAGAELGS
jgi:uncharacterized protein